MKSKFAAQLKMLKPTSREEVKAALGKMRSHAGGAVAFEADVLPAKQHLMPRRKFAVKI